VPLNMLGSLDFGVIQKNLDSIWDKLSDQTDPEAKVHSFSFPFK